MVKLKNFTNGNPMNLPSCEWMKKQDSINILLFSLKNYVHKVKQEVYLWARHYYVNKRAKWNKKYKSKIEEAGLNRIHFSNFPYSAIPLNSRILIWYYIYVIFSFLSMLSDCLLIFFFLLLMVWVLTTFKSEMRWADLSILNC